MKLLLVNSRYYPNHYGGAEETLRLLAEGLAARGHDVTVVSLARSPEQRQGTFNSVKCLYLPVGKSFLWQDTGRLRYVFRLWRYLLDFYNISMQRRFSRVLKEIRPDAVGFHNIKGFSPSIWVSGYIAKVPLVQMIHDYFLICLNSTMFRSGKECRGRCIRCRLGKCSIGYLSHLVSHWIANSKFTRERVRSSGLFYKDARFSVLYPSITLSASPMRREDKRPGDQIVFGFLGRIDSSKGVDVLLEAFCQLTARKARLLIGGSGYDEYISALKSRFEDDRVTFLGQVSPSSFFADIDLLVVPSQWNEPFGRVIVEAFSFGIPVIASALGGMVELVEHGKTGILFDASADQLYRVLADISTRGLQSSYFYENCLYAARAFSTEIAIENYERILQKVAAEAKCDA